MSISAGSSSSQHPPKIPTVLLNQAGNLLEFAERAEATQISAEQDVLDGRRDGDDPAKRSLMKLGHHAPTRITAPRGAAIARHRLVLSLASSALKRAETDSLAAADYPPR
jgi:hypothetical protein